jgi:hypothetical protein
MLSPQRNPTASVDIADCGLRLREPSGSERFRNAEFGIDRLKNRGDFSGSFVGEATVPVPPNAGSALSPALRFCCFGIILNFGLWSASAPESPPGTGGLKGHNKNEISFPGSPGLWPGSFTFDIRV